MRGFTSLCALAVPGAYFAAHQAGLMAWNGADKSTPAMALLTGLLGAVGAALPWVPSRLRTRAMLLASLLVAAFVFRFLVLVPLLITFGALRISRQPWATSKKLALVLGGWVGIVLLSWIAPRGVGLPYRALAVYLGCLPAPLICLIVERARGQLDGVQPIEEWLYLLGIPRVVVPFLQPIGAVRFIKSRQQSTTGWRLPLSAVALALYGIAGCAAIRYTHYLVMGANDAPRLTVHGPRILNNMLHVYAINATAIFVVIPMFRIMGYELGSGFRFPLLSASFGELYRRWNYYYYEYVSSIFYMPLVNWLRRRVPLKVAYVLAGYPSFLLGAWALDNVGVQFTYGNSPERLLRQLGDWRELLNYAIIWTLVIFSQMLLTPLRPLRRFWWWRGLAHVVTVAAIVAIVTTLFVYQLTVY